MMGDLIAGSSSVSRAYLIVIILFMVALFATSSAKFRPMGSRFGMAAIALAAAVTIAVHNAAALPEILIALALGGGIGLIAARRVPLAAVPRLAALFHGFVGLAIMAVNVALYLDPETFDLVDPRSLEIWGYCRIELAIGLALGGIIFSGSCVAFWKLSASAIPTALSLLSSCSGWAALSMGLALQNGLMTVVGLLIGCFGAMFGCILWMGAKSPFSSRITDIAA